MIKNDRENLNYQISLKQKNLVKAERFTNVREVGSLTSDLRFLKEYITFNSFLKHSNDVLP